MSKVYALDTNIILDDPHHLVSLSEEGKNKIIIPEVVLDELDGKKSGFEDINYNARQFARLLEDSEITNKKEYDKISVVETLIEPLNITIHIISQKKYQCEDTTIALNILNDRKILEATKNYQDIINDRVIFLSIDIMARTRALSLDLDTETLKGKDQEIEYRFHKELTVPNVNGRINGKNILELDPDYSPMNYSYTVIDENTMQQKIGQVHNGHFYLIPEKAPHKRYIQPLNKEQKFFVNAIEEGYADILVIDAKAGCVLPGTEIEVEVDSMYMSYDDISSELGISLKDVKKISRYLGTKSNTIDINSIRRWMLRAVSLNSAQITILNNDKKYNSKYLKLRYWLGTDESIDECVKRVKLTRRYKEYFDIDYNKLEKKGFNISNIDETCYKIQFKLLSFRYSKISEIEGFSFSNRCREYWSFRGFTEDESVNKVKGYQKANVKNKLDKYTALDYRKASPRCVEHWISKGYSEEEAAKQVSDQQRHGALDRYQERHGKVEGTRRWKERQVKWQETLNSKPQEEIDRINKSKGTTPSGEPHSGSYTMRRFKDNPGLAETKGYLYYVQLNIEGKELYKIGITKNFKTRLKHFSKYDPEVIRLYESTLLDCYQKEQSILSNYDGCRVTVKGVSTELFTENIVKDI